MKKIICFLLTSIFCLCGLVMLSSCGGFGADIRLCENEYFIYWADYEDNEIKILGLTDKGREQEYLVIPETIDGMNVIGIGCNSGGDVSSIKEKYGDEKYAQFKSDKLRKIFIISEVDIVQGWMVDKIVENREPFEAIFYISNQKSWVYTPDVFFFFTSMKGEKDLKSWNKQLQDPYNCYYAANVSYYYNYETAPNDGYYWIDNYAYGEKIEYIPENPTRDGYTFDGWYKESECINAWNFEVDTLPEEQFNEEEITIYQETKLYAKWI